MSFDLSTCSRDQFFEFSEKLLKTLDNTKFSSKMLNERVAGALKSANPHLKVGTPETIYVSGFPFVVPNDSDALGQLVEEMKNAARTFYQKEKEEGIRERLNRNIDELTLVEKKISGDKKRAQVGVFSGGPPLKKPSPDLSCNQKAANKKQLMPQEIKASLMSLNEESKDLLVKIDEAVKKTSEVNEELQPFQIKINDLLGRARLIRDQIERQSKEVVESNRLLGALRTVSQNINDVGEIKKTLAEVLVEEKVESVIVEKPPVQMRNLIEHNKDKGLVVVKKEAFAHIVRLQKKMEEEAKYTAFFVNQEIDDQLKSYVKEIKLKHEGIPLEDARKIAMSVVKQVSDIEQTQSSSSKIVAEAAVAGVIQGGTQHYIQRALFDVGAIVLTGGGNITNTAIAAAVTYGPPFLIAGGLKIACGPIATGLSKLGEVAKNAILRKRRYTENEQVERDSGRRLGGASGPSRLVGLPEKKRKVDNSEPLQRVVAGEKNKEAIARERIAKDFIMDSNEVEFFKPIVLNVLKNGKNLLEYLASLGKQKSPATTCLELSMTSEDIVKNKEALKSWVEILQEVVQRLDQKTIQNFCEQIGCGIKVIDFDEMVKQSEGTAIKKILYQSKDSQQIEIFLLKEKDIYRFIFKR